MATLASAKKKYADALKNMPAHYAEGMADFLGISEGDVKSSGPGMAYIGKMKSGLEDKWAKRLAEAFGG